MLAMRHCQTTLYELIAMPRAVHSKRCLDGVVQVVQVVAVDVLAVGASL
jgi:hypothetical protein